MKKDRLDAEFDDFYLKCLKELKARENYTDAFLPMLDRFVMLTIKLSKLNSAIVDKEVIQDHTNKAEKTNKVSDAEWRMYLALNQEACKLARYLRLSPENAPIKVTKEKPKGAERFMTKTA
jgi:deoxyadenosine/deoxycytidine kinase